MMMHVYGADKEVVEFVQSASILQTFNSQSQLKILNACFIIYSVKQSNSLYRLSNIVL